MSGFAGSLGASGWSSVMGTSGAAIIAFGALSGIGAELSGGNFWQGAVIGGIVAGLNHAMHEMDHNIEENYLETEGECPTCPKKKVGIISSKVSKPKNFKDRLRLLADTTEEVGGWMEVAGLGLAPFTEGASLLLTSAGAHLSIGGTTINVGIDIYDGNYKMATFRVLKQAVTAGMGKAIDRIPGVKYSLDKALWNINIKLWEHALTPNLQPQKIK